MSNVINEYINPRVPMGQKLIKWCQKHGVIDTSFYTAGGTRWEWDYIKDVVSRHNGYDFFRFLDGGIETFNYWVEHLTENEHAIYGSFIGMTSEGPLNHALHYMSDYQLEHAFTKFLAKYGYKWTCVSNCYYLIYRIPHIVTIKD